MYTGWGRDHPGVEAGVQNIAGWGPSADNMYYNYYATQVMFHYTDGKGDLWKQWNDKMREHLVATQAKEGHAEGSWVFAGGHLSRGGRVASTCLSAMILEVYYRFSPVYSKQVVSGAELQEAALDN